MTGYATLHASCFACHRPFSCNPRKVPSYKGEPICESCIRRVNENRKRNGLPLWPVADDAYEPCPEGEL